MLYLCFKGQYNVSSEVQEKTLNRYWPFTTCFQLL